MEYEIEQCGAGQGAKKNASASSTKTLGSADESSKLDVDDPAVRKAAADRFIEEHAFEVDIESSVREAKTLKSTIEAFDQIAETSLSKVGKQELNLNGTNYEMSHIRRVDYLLNIVSDKQLTPEKVAGVDLAVLLAYQKGAANFLEIPPPSIRAMHVGLPAVIPHMSKFQAKQVLSEFPLNLPIQPPSIASKYAVANADTYTKNVRLAQAHALKVLEKTDSRAFGYEGKKLAKIENGDVPK